LLYWELLEIFFKYGTGSKFAHFPNVLISPTAGAQEVQFLIHLDRDTDTDLVMDKVMVKVMVVVIVIVLVMVMVMVMDMDI
jgi:hypothetical protein